MPAWVDSLLRLPSLRYTTPNVANSQRLLLLSLLLLNANRLLVLPLLVLVTADAIKRKLFAPASEYPARVSRPCRRTFATGTSTLQDVTTTARKSNCQNSSSFSARCESPLCAARTSAPKDYYSRRRQAQFVSRRPQGIRQDLLSTPEDSATRKTTTGGDVR